MPFEKKNVQGVYATSNTPCLISPPSLSVWVTHTHTCLHAHKLYKPFNTHTGMLCEKSNVQSHYIASNTACLILPPSPSLSLMHTRAYMHTVNCTKRSQTGMLCKKRAMYNDLMSHQTWPPSMSVEIRSMWLMRPFHRHNIVLVCHFILSPTQLNQPQNKMLFLWDQ